MAYCIGNGIWDGVFAVPNAVTDTHLKLASGLSIKVLLLALRRGGKVEPGEMAQMLGQTVSDIQDAVNYWVTHGILSPEEAVAPPAVEEPAVAARPADTSGHSLTPILSYKEIPDPAPHRPAAKAAEGNPADRVKTLSSSRPRLTTAEINELAKQDKSITYLLQETQSVLGKPLTPVASSTMASLYSYSGMQPDLILMLVHYCVSIGKDSMRYIERVADDWVEKGIDTHEKAEAEILRLTRKNDAENKVKAAFGIHDRSLVTSEKAYIRAWTEEYKLELPLIKLAYERSVELKGKLSFAYINGILTNWHTAGIKTPAQAMEEIKSGKRPGQSQAKGQGSSYDMVELEKMITYGDV